MAVLCNGEATDLSTPLSTDTVMEPILASSEEGAHILRHSTAHIMAQAVKELFGQDVKVAIGPAIEDGYYYDFDRATAFTPDDFVAIEERMAEIVQARLPFARRELPLTEAIVFLLNRERSTRSSCLRIWKKRGRRGSLSISRGILLISVGDPIFRIPPG